MSKKILISTSFFIDSEQRINQYIESFQTYHNFKDKFDDVIIIETSQNNVDYVNDSGFNVFYSPLDNEFPNKGYNWIRHLTNYLNTNIQINDDDILTFITGRYMLVNDNMVNLINTLIVPKKYDLFAKDDSDIYPNDGINNGVHTFYFSSRIKTFKDFHKWYFDNQHWNVSGCIEYSLRRYMEKNNNKCIVLPKETVLGVIARPSCGTINQLT
jgi:hypothetical protein